MRSSAADAAVAASQAAAANARIGVTNKGDE
jgi:hypothetical protein